MVVVVIVHTMPKPATFVPDLDAGDDIPEARAQAKYLLVETEGQNASMFTLMILINSDSAINKVRKTWLGDGRGRKPLPTYLC